MGELFMTASVFISALLSLMPLSKLLVLPLLSTSVKVLLDESKLRDTSDPGTDKILKFIRSSGCCASDLQAEEDRNKVNNNLKIAIT